MSRRRRGGKASWERKQAEAKAFLNVLMTSIPEPKPIPKRKLKRLLEREGMSIGSKYRPFPFWKYLYGDAKPT
jgi:hypothetical protein